MNKVAYETCFCIFLLVVGLMTCWTPRMFERASDELDRRLRPDGSEFDSYVKMVLQSR